MIASAWPCAAISAPPDPFSLFAIRLGI